MDVAREALLKKSETSLDRPMVKGYDFNQGIDYSEMFRSYATTGLQATNLHRAIEIVKSMVSFT